MTRPEAPAVERWPTDVYLGAERERLEDPVVVEEPLEIQLRIPAAEAAVPLTVTMRTPGEDLELAAGLLYAEAIVERPEQIRELRTVRTPERPLDNRVEVELADGVEVDPARTARSFVSSSACGVCGKVSVDSIFVQGFPGIPAGVPRVAREVLADLPRRMRAGQRIFSRTGGLHAAAVFSAAGELVALREDVGRHNAVDKVLGHLFLEGRLPAGELLLAVSGRAGFELSQKAVRAGIPLMAAVGAPSSLALRLAHRAGMTVVGFLRDDRFNVYTAAERVAE